MQCLPIRSLAGILLTGLLVVGCESKKAPATAATSASTAAPKLLSDTLAATHVSATDTADKAAPRSPSEDVHAFHEPFEERKTVAPGLVIVIKSIQQPDTAVIRDPWDIKVTFSLLQNGSVI